MMVGMVQLRQFIVFDVHLSNVSSSNRDGYDIHKVMNDMSMNNYLISIWYFLDILIFANIKSIIDHMIAQKGINISQQY